MSSRKIKLFAERDLDQYLYEKRVALSQEIRTEDKNRLLNSNETQYIKYLLDKYYVEPLCFHWDRMQVSDAERSQGGQRIYVITYHVPYSGEQKLIECAPAARLLWTIEAKIDNQFLSFDIVNLMDVETVKHQATDIVDSIKHQTQYLLNELEHYNKPLEETIKQSVQSRKNTLLSQANLVTSLGVPFFKSGNVPSTFSVPIIKKEVIVKPAAPNTPYAPEFSIDDTIYQDILQIIYDTGIEIERHPDIYKDKQEEPLRDHFLMVLSPHFKSATAETFNRKGKTDILIRHENRNVFIAECKFWSGTKSYLEETIYQILGNLTWRDSKAAIICFIRNKELNPILEKIENETPKHRCFVKYHGKKHEGWFNFEFHFKDDPTRSVQIAVLCFHFPN